MIKHQNYVMVKKLNKYGFLYLLHANKSNQAATTLWTSIMVLYVQNWIFRSICILLRANEAALIVELYFTYIRSKSFQDRIIFNGIRFGCST